MFNAKNIYLFETDNFQIRKAEPNNEDASICLSLNNNGLVTKYMGFPNGIGTTLDKEKSNIAKNYNSYSEKGGRMLCFLKQTGECAGYMSCGHHINKDNFDEIDYKFFPQFWGKGYGFELVSALIKYVRETIETSAGIETSPNVDNIASIRISEKCGLKKIRDVVYESNETAIKCVLMRMTKEEYFETSIYEDYRIKILSNLLKKTNGKITNDDMKRLKNALNLDNRGLLTLVKKVGNAILKMEGLNVRDNFVKNIKTAISNMSKLDEKRAKAKKAEPNTETKSRAEKLHLDKKKSKITFFGKWAIFYVARFALFTMPKLLLYSAPKHIIRRVFGGGKNVSGGVRSSSADNKSQPSKKQPAESRSNLEKFKLERPAPISPTMPPPDAPSLTPSPSESPAPGVDPSANTLPKEPSTGGYSPSNDPQPKQPLQTLPLSDKKSPQSPMPPGKNGAGPMETAQPGEKERNMSTSLVAERKNKHFLEEEINNDEEKSIKRKKQSQHTHLQKLGESRTPNASSFPNH